MATAKRLKKQAERCAALAEQTQDDEARRRYVRLEQLYLNLAESEDSAGPSRIESAA
jgi:hypothetical protein